MYKIEAVADIREGKSKELDVVTKVDSDFRRFLIHFHLACFVFDGCSSTVCYRHRIQHHQ